jgi:hypothetical protein
VYLDGRAEPVIQGTFEHRRGRQLLDSQSDGSPARTVNAYVWYNALAPVDGADAARIVELTDRAVATASSATERMAHTNTYAAALYRAGRYDAARIWLLKSVAALAGGFLEDWRFLALTEQRLGHASEARDWLEKSKTWLANPPEKYPNDLPVLAHWTARVARDVRRREAESLILPQAAMP